MLEVNQVETAEVQGGRVGVRPEPNTAPLNKDGATGVKESTSEESVTSPVMEGLSAQAGGQRRRHACKIKKRGRGLKSFKLASPLERELQELLGQNFTSKLCAPRGYRPAFVDYNDVDLDPSGVKACPGPGSHVLVCGSASSYISRLLRMFRAATKKEPSIVGTFMVPNAPKSRWWSMLPGRMVKEYPAGCEIGTGTRMKIPESQSWVVYNHHSREEQGGGA